MGTIAYRTDSLLPEISTSELSQGTRLPTPASPYELKYVPARTVAVVYSTVARAGHDGLAMFPWLAKNGYVEVGPTRREYLNNRKATASIPLRIVVPIEKRRSGLRHQE